MNIEDFFINEYKRLQKENEGLRAKLDILEQARSEYGVYDMGYGVNMVRVNVQSSYVFTSDSYRVTKLTLDKIDSLIDADDETLVKWAEGFQYDSYSNGLLKIEKMPYRYVIEVRDMDGARTYALDTRYNEDLVEIGAFDDMAPYDTIGEWVEAEHLEEVKRYACTQLRERLRKTREAVAAKEANDGPDNE